MLGQWLQQTVAQGTGIDNTAFTDQTDWVEPETFPGSIGSFVGNKEEEVMEAKRYTAGVRKLSFSTDV